jgi:hypothetical protein
MSKLYCRSLFRDFSPGGHIYIYIIYIYSLRGDVTDMTGRQILQKTGRRQFNLLIIAKTV